MSQNLADFFTLAPRVTLMGATRLTRSRVELRDQLGDDLTGDHEFTRVNPSAGMTFAVSPQVTLYGSVGVSSRVPTPSELGCADPEDPCRLPNAFVADPPLAQVVATTWEGGARGRLGGWQWTASAFRTRNRDDIIFISSGALTREGHFENIGTTLRRGLEFSGAGAVGPRVRASAAYTYLRATFGLLGDADDVLGDAYDDPRFLSPGAPRAAWVGLELSF